LKQENPTAGKEEECHFSWIDMTFVDRQLKTLHRLTTAISKFKPATSARL
jgi:hypothetical protein